eukprot:s2745_g5.t1
MDVRAGSSSETANAIVSLVKTLDLQLTLNDGEELVVLVRSIIDMTKMALANNNKEKRLTQESLAKISKKVVHEKLSHVGNSFAIVFVELLDVFALNVADWEAIETSLELIVAAKHVREFEFLDHHQEEEREIHAMKQFAENRL